MTVPQNNFSNLLPFLKSDGLENVLTGMGVEGRDSRLGARYRWKRNLYRTLETFHDASDIAKTVVNKIPEMATKKWLTHIVEEKEDSENIITKLLEEDERLEVKTKVKKAMSWARLYGGAVIFLIVDDGLELEEPLNFDRINRIQNLLVLHRFEIYNSGLTEDLASPNFGLPEFFDMSGRSNTLIPRIHYSRFIRFEGSPLSEHGFQLNDYWHDSHLTILHDIARDYEDAYNGVFRALKDFDIEVIKLKELASMVSGKRENEIMSRLRLLQLSKSTISTIAIDAEGEDFMRIQRTFTGVAGMIEKIDKRLQSVTGLPHTILFGEGSTGTLGAAGESEQNTLNDLIATEQKNAMEKQLTFLFKLIQLQKQGPTGGKLLETHKFTFNPLNEATDRQQAEVRKMVADTDKIYNEIGVLSSEDIVDSRFGPYGYSLETNVDLEARKLQKEIDDIPIEENNNVPKRKDPNGD